MEIAHGGCSKTYSRVGLIAGGIGQEVGDLG
jgi:hypothetical protein